MVLKIYAKVDGRSLHSFVQTVHISSGVYDSQRLHDIWYLLILEGATWAIIIGGGGQSVWGLDGLVISNIWMEGGAIGQQFMDLW